MGSRAKPQAGPAGVQETALAGRYEFYAVADRMRIKLGVDAVCGSDAEASLVGLSLTTPSIGVEVQREGRLIYQAPIRARVHAPLVAGSA